MTLKKRLSNLEAAATKLPRVFFIGITPTSETLAEHRAAIDAARAEGDDLIIVRFIGVKPNES